MRSEKEIRIYFEKLRNLPAENAIAFSIKKLQLKDLEWVLEGEPRFSVAELEKLVKKDPNYFHECNCGEEVGDFLDNFLDFLKDSKKVKEALK